jgi:hypothetical protein
MRSVPCSWLGIDLWGQALTGHREHSKGLRDSMEVCGRSNHAYFVVD